jgi:hypothetical protein
VVDGVAAREERSVETASCGDYGLASSSSTSTWAWLI